MFAVHLGKTCRRRFACRSQPRKSRAGPRHGCPRLRHGRRAGRAELENGERPSRARHAAGRWRRRTLPGTKARPADANGGSHAVRVSWVISSAAAASRVTVVKYPKRPACNRGRNSRPVSASPVSRSVVRHRGPASPVRAHPPFSARASRGEYDGASNVHQRDTGGELAQDAERGPAVARPARESGSPFES